MSALLSLSGVETHIGQYHILHGVDLDVPDGRTTMLLGRNGAGKTTTLRTIMGLWHASSGEIRLGGERIEALSDARYRARRHRLRAGDHGGVLPISRCAKTSCWRRAKARWTRRASTGFSVSSRR